MLRRRPAEDVCVGGTRPMGAETSAERETYFHIPALISNGLIEDPNFYGLRCVPVKHMDIGDCSIGWVTDCICLGAWSASMRTEQRDLPDFLFFF